MKKVFIATLLLLCIGVSTALPSEKPTEILKTTVEKIIDILRNKELKKPEMKDSRRRILRSTIEEVFDFEEMSKRTLGIYWRKRTEKERKEFVELFSRLLERTYINKIESYTDEKIIFTEERVKGNYAIVKSIVKTRQATEISIDYRMLKKDNRWVVYDVIIEGVSLVKNYRTQFREIIRKGSYSVLVQKIKENLEKENG
jgi:phospholipid transport system substrate-binding protein